MPANQYYDACQQRENRLIKIFLNTESLCDGLSGNLNHLIRLLRIHLGSGQNLPGHTNSQAFTGITGNIGDEVSLQL